MILLTLAANKLTVEIPAKMKVQASRLLKAIWRSEFNDRLRFELELTEAVREFVNQARILPGILVCQ